MKKIAIRFDDVCETMHYENFNKILNIIEEYNVKPLIGIVPSNSDDNLIVNNNVKLEEYYKLIYELKSKGYLFAQHGYDHVYVNRNGGILKLNKNSEYAGLSYDEQYQKIKKGKEILEKNDIHSNIFMAPSHSYDENTLLALKDLGFKYVTDGFTKFNYKYKELIFIPCMHAFNPKKSKGIITLCIHANTMNDFYIDMFKKILDKNKDFLVDFNVLLEEKYRKRFKFIQFFNLTKYKIILKIKSFIKKIINKK